MSDKAWRTDVDAGDYFLHQRKQLDIADRRPVIKKASDLVGPGIDSGAVRITDFNDLLATFNGYFSAAPGAYAAPTETDTFVGIVVSDSEFGGHQQFTSQETGVIYTRRFQRSPVDPEALAWSAWVERRRIPSTLTGETEVDTRVPHNTAVQLVPPNISLMGDGVATYQRTSGAINIMRQGIYTGMVQVGDRVSATTSNVTVALYKPLGSATQPSTHVNVSMAGTFYIPFTVVASDAGQAFYVTVQQLSGADRDMWWRMSCTRVGDAV